MKRNIKMEIREYGGGEFEEPISGFEMINEEEYKIRRIDSILYGIRESLKKIHWNEFMNSNFQEKIVMIVFFILIMFLISIFILRFYWKKFKS